VRPADQDDGDIITGWLLQLLAILAVISLVVYEVVAIGVAAVSVDEDARDAARVAAVSYRTDRSLPLARETADAAVTSEHTDVVSLTESNGELVITMSRRARTLLVHRVAALQDLATASTTRRVRWEP
jgi:apolipoprotein N-acyltransferase